MSQRNVSSSTYSSTSSSPSRSSASTIAPVSPAADGVEGACLSATAVAARAAAADDVGDMDADGDLDAVAEPKWLGVGNLVRGGNCNSRCNHNVHVVKPNPNSSLFKHELRIRALSASRQRPRAQRRDGCMSFQCIDARNTTTAETGTPFQLACLANGADSVSAMSCPKSFSDGNGCGGGTESEARRSKREREVGVMDEEAVAAIAIVASGFGPLGVKDVLINGGSTGSGGGGGGGGG